MKVFARTLLAALARSMFVFARKDPLRFLRSLVLCLSSLGPSLGFCARSFYVCLRSERPSLGFCARSFVLASLGPSVWSFLVRLAASVVVLAVLVPNQPVRPLAKTSVALTSIGGCRPTLMTTVSSVLRTKKHSKA